MNVRISYNDDGYWDFHDADTGKYAYFVPGWVGRNEAIMHCENHGDVVINSVMHSIFEYPPTMPINESERQALRDLYRELLDRAIEITSYPSGWTSGVKWASIADCDQAGIIGQQYFMTFGAVSKIPPL